MIAEQHHLVQPRGKMSTDTQEASLALNKVRKETIDCHMTYIHPLEPVIASYPSYPRITASFQKSMADLFNRPRLDWRTWLPDAGQTLEPANL